LIRIPAFRRMPESSNRLKINFWMTRYARPVGRPPGVQRAVAFVRVCARQLLLHCPAACIPAGVRFARNDELISFLGTLPGIVNCGIYLAPSDAPAGNEAASWMFRYPTIWAMRLYGIILLSNNYNYQKLRFSSASVGITMMDRQLATRSAESRASLIRVHALFGPGCCHPAAVRGDTAKSPAHPGGV
jgi:hypothetical protein